MHHTLPLYEPDYQEVFDKSPMPGVLLNPDLHIVACNRAYERNANRPRREMVNRSILEAFPSLETSERALKASLDHVREHRCEHQIPLLYYPISSEHQGKGALSDRYWTVSNIPLLGESGELRFILHLPTDITELTQLRRIHAESASSVTSSIDSGSANHWARDVQEVLKAERERLHQLFQQAPGFICVLRGPQHVYELANDAYYQLIGHREILGRVLAEVLPEVIEQGYLAKLDRVFSTGEPFIGRALPIELQRLAGGDLEQCYIDIVYQPILEPGGQVSGIFVQGHDVTEAHQLAQEVSYQAAHDPLTGLYNRREFARRTRDLEGRSGSHALLYMDLDHFKIINDRCGHAAGDALLVQVTRSLRQHHGPDALLARLGGDEFALVLPGCPGKDALELAHQLRRKVEDIPFFWSERRYSMTLSIGLVSFGADQALSFAEALSLADMACFMAKEKGRNRVQVSHSSDIEITQRHRDMDWADRIKECMREDRVVLHGQRIVGLQAQAEDGLECYEILTRLLDAEGGLVYPAAFIPAAERFGFIHKLDRHIVRKAFGALQELPAERRARTRYFINLSGITLGSASLSTFIEQLLTDFPDVLPSQVCFEVTETAAISNLAHSASTVRHLTEKGFSFALDDFGSGMSSFSYLEQLPVQYLKIDGAFIKGILTRPAGAVIVQAVAEVAKAMNILTVAESVESSELLPILQGMGIDYGQGYALHRPEPL